MLEATYRSTVTSAKWERHDGQWRCVISPNGRQVKRILTQDLDDRRLESLLNSKCRKVKTVVGEENEE